MKISTLSFVFLLFATQCFAESKLKNSTNFSTRRDFAASASSANLKLKNTGTYSKTVYGLYVRQFSYVAAGQSCSGATVLYSASQNSAAGSFVMPVAIAANNEAVIGSNYLYNMIYNAIYYLQIIASTVCLLPGCTWGSDTTIYNWCIYLGALAPVSVGGSFNSSVVPSAAAVSTVNYNYDLVSSYGYLGPISCDDQTLTCSVATSQTQSF